MLQQVLISLLDSEIRNVCAAAGREGTDVRKFLNRLLGLKIVQQTLLFNYFFFTLRAVISAAKTEGLYTEGVADVQGKSIVRISEQSVLWVDPVSQLTTFKNAFLIDRGITFEEACKVLELERGLDDASGFYKSRRRNFGSYAFILAVQKSGKKSNCKIYRPNTGSAPFEMTEEQLKEHHVQVPVSDAETGWREKYDSSLDTCIHGFDCPMGDRCKVGKRQINMMVLSGSVVRVWGVLESVLQRHQSKLRKSDAVMKIVRVPLKNERHLIGLKYPEHLLSEVIVALTMKHEVGRERENKGTSNSSRPMRQDASPVVPKLVQRLTQEPKTLMHYFSKRCPASPEDADAVTEPTIKKRRRTKEPEEDKSPSCPN